ncbi:MAG: ribbon-helix-helix domain-containing protein [Anaerolineaceae bacterium]
MTTEKIAITIDQQLLSRIDKLVAEKRFPNRSKAFQEAVTEKLQRLDRTRLTRECAKLIPYEEQQLSEEHLLGEIEWPEY